MGTNKYVVEAFLGGGWFPETNVLTYEEAKRHIEFEAKHHPNLQLRLAEVEDRKVDIRDVDLYTEPTYAVKIADAIEQAYENTPENKAKNWYKQIKETLTEQEFVDQVLRMNSRISEATKELEAEVSVLNSKNLVLEHRKHNLINIIKDLASKLSTVDKEDLNKELAAVLAIVEEKEGSELDTMLNSLHVYHLNGTT